MTFRSVLFWAHLAAGLVAGVAIGIMCLTGTVLAFEQEIVAWAERDARQVAVPAEATSAIGLQEWKPQGSSTGRARGVIDRTGAI